MDLHDALCSVGVKNRSQVYYQLPISQLVELSIFRKEGFFSEDGTLIVNTMPYTGRCANDKYIVDDLNDDQLWLGKANTSFSREAFTTIKDKLCNYLASKPIFVRDLCVCTDPNYKLDVRIITELAWHSLAADNLFVEVDDQQKSKPNKSNGITVICAPGFKADPALDQTKSEVFVVLDIKNKLILIGGTAYCGEIKKSVFSMLNYLLPKMDVLPLHCSANIGAERDVALFFGLSGTGKTTLSSDPLCVLIGDDEHGWAKQGIFNFEGGCYAKTVNLDKNQEPLIWKALHQFGAVAENVYCEPETRRMDFFDVRFTENTRASYPLSYIANKTDQAVSAHPKNIFFLTADAFGIFPPISKLTKAQAIYYFLSGYTAKLAGTELGLTNEPKATFSTCFGEPFLPLLPSVYADLLSQRIDSYAPDIWLLNTGWIGGAFGIGSRIPLRYTRAIITAIRSKRKMEMRKDTALNLQIPGKIASIPEEVLSPVLNWKDKTAYLNKAAELFDQFNRNFQQFHNIKDEEIINAAPRLI